MVKGMNRQVVVVRGTRSQLFEQAIFLLRADAEQGVSEQALLDEARCAAEDVSERPGALRRRQAALYALSGAAVTAAAWLLTALL